MNFFLIFKELIHFQGWHFSSSMEAIDDWQMIRIGKVSDHLKNCPYNVRNDHINAAKRNPRWDAIINKISKFDLFQGLKRVNY